jgi:hypothetical protein
VPRISSSGFAEPIVPRVALTLKLWQLLVLAALVLLAAGVLLGRYFVPAADDGKYVAIATGTPWGTVYVKGNREDVRAYEERGEQSRAQANLRAAIPSVEAYYADKNAYTGMTVPYLKTTYDSGIEDVAIRSATSTTYCVESTVGSETWSKAGPAADIVEGSCPQ